MCNSHASQLFLTRRDPFYGHWQPQLWNLLPRYKSGLTTYWPFDLEQDTLCTWVSYFKWEWYPSYSVVVCIKWVNTCEVLGQHLVWNRCTLNCVRLVFPHIQIHATNSPKYTCTNPTITFTSCFTYLEWFQSLSLFQNSQSIDSFLSRIKACDTVLTSSQKPPAHEFPSRKRSFCFLSVIFKNKNKNKLLLDVDFVWPLWTIFQRLLTYLYIRSRHYTQSHGYCILKVESHMSATLGIIITQRRKRMMMMKKKNICWVLTMSQLPC